MPPSSSRTGRSCGGTCPRSRSIRGGAFGTTSPQAARGSSTSPSSRIRASRTSRVPSTQGSAPRGGPLGAGAPPNRGPSPTSCAPPHIARPSPANGDGGVALAAPIAIPFSEPMDATVTTATISPPISLTGTWDGARTVLTLAHLQDFAPCTLHTVTTLGQDLDGGS